MTPFGRYTPLQEAVRDEPQKVMPGMELPPGPRASQRGWRWAYTVSAALATLTLLPILIRPGFPAYQHDWSWPPETRSILNGVIGHLSTWDAQGLGFPNALASANVINLLVGIPAAIVGADAAVRLVLLVPFVAAAIGIVLVSARVAFAPPWCAVAASLAYVTSPVLLSNLGAGHVGFWYAYALLPYILWLGFESARSKPLVFLPALCLLGSLITIQPQFAAFGLAAAIAGALMGRPKAVWLPAAVFLAGAVISLVPVFVAINSAGGYIDLVYPRPELGWERLLSTPLPDVIWTVNYVVPYYAQATIPGSFYALGVFSVLALVSIVIVRPVRYAIALGLLVIGGILVATGVVGPAQSLWSFLYANFYPATVFRDASNGAVLLALAYAFAVAASWRRIYVALLLVAYLLIAALPFLIGHSGLIAKNVVLPRYAQIREEIKSFPNGRIASTPLVTPVVFDDTNGGIDVDAVSDAMHPSLAEYPTIAPLTNIAIVDQPTALWFVEALSRMGVVGLVQRPDFWSDDLSRQGVKQKTPQATSLTPIASSGEVFFPRASVTEPLSYKAPLQANAVGLTSPDGPLPERGSNEGVRIRDLFYKTALSDNPRLGWTLLSRWYGLDGSKSTFGQGLVTLSSTPLIVSLPQGGWWLLHSGGPLNLRSGAFDETLPGSSEPRWDPVSSDGQLVVRSLRGEAVAYRLAQGRDDGVPLRNFGSATVIAYSSPAPWRVNVLAKTRSHGPWLLVFRTRYAPGWNVLGAPTQWHGVADGYANAFVLSALPATLNLYYEPQRAFMACCIAVWFFQLALVVLCLQTGRLGGKALRDQLERPV